MSKIYINIIIPSLGKRVELKVSRKVKIGELISKLKEYLIKEYAENEDVFNEVRLCDEKSGVIYAYNASLIELDVYDGQEMLLI